MRVLDGAVVVFDGVAGVEPQSETVWRQADKYKVPRVCFINKLDRMGASFERSYASILERLTDKAVRIQLPMGLEENFEGVVDLLKMKAYNFEGEHGEKIVEIEIPENLKTEAEKYHAELVEKIVETNDVLMERYLAGEKPDLAELRKTLREATIAGQIIPVLTGSALKIKVCNLCWTQFCIIYQARQIYYRLKVLIRILMPKKVAKLKTKLHFLLWPLKWPLILLWVS